jgi:hypothetical protein
MVQSTLTFSRFLGAFASIATSHYRDFATRGSQHSALQLPSSDVPRRRYSSCRAFATSRPHDLNLPIFGLLTCEPRAREIFDLCHLYSTRSGGPHALTDGFRDIASRDLATFDANICGSNSQTSEFMIGRCHLSSSPYKGCPSDTCPPLRP